jgi:hypothetical protein
MISLESHCFPALGESPEDVSGTSSHLPNAHISAEGGLTRRLSWVNRTATPASTFPTVKETSILADRHEATSWAMHSA